MKRQYSGKKLVIVIFFVMLTVAVLCLTVCGGYALYNSMQDMMTYNRVALDLYLNDLTLTSLAQMDKRRSKDQLSQLNL